MGATFSFQRFAATALILSASWFVLSGKTDAMYLAIGIGSSLVLAATLDGWRDGQRIRPLALAAFLPWLVWQILLSNLRVARVVFDPRLPIRPTFLRVEPGVRGARALTTVGASLTLTPGTLTVEVDEHSVFVHALDEQSVKDTRDGLIPGRVARCYRADERAGGRGP